MRRSKISKNKVEESQVGYSAMNFKPMAALLGNPCGIEDDFDLINFARSGIYKKALLEFAKRISLTIEELANVLHISERTLQRYEATTLVKTEHSDRAISLARLYEKGESVFGNQKDFKIWMRTPNTSLNQEVPLSLLDTTIGFEMVHQILGRMEYGVFS